MSMPAHYKDCRERLDELLEKMNVPKIHYNNLTSLNKFICFYRNASPYAREAVDIIHKIAPMTLVRFPIRSNRHKK